MLASNTYDKSEVQACRRQMQAQLQVYGQLLAAQGGADAAAVAAFEALFFKHLVLALDRCFVHRTRGLEKKDGNPLNEVRMLCAAITAGQATLQADPTIRYDAARSVLKLKIGDEIRISLAGFQALSEAYFDDIVRKFT
jgi:hypothetical protein